jgi:tryptophan synthase alpha chain
LSYRLNHLIEKKRAESKKLLSVFLTAGYPRIEDTVDLVLNLAEARVDFIELGIPFSDPIADGPVIQKTSNIALKNGIQLEKILDMVSQIRRYSSIPLLLMGYLNPIHKMGIDKFIVAAHQVGADGLIIPDWPVEESSGYQSLLRENNLDLIHLIAPNTSFDRIKKIDTASTSFIYCVAYTGVTGKNNKPAKTTIDFFALLQKTITHPFMIGFGIKSKEDFEMYTKYADGAIVGTAFLRFLGESSFGNRKEEVYAFINNLRELV